MILFPNCKINLGLQIKDRREDGFHNLETVFYPIGINDALEIVVRDNGQTTLSISGIPIDAKAEDNICIKAYRLLQQAFPHLPPVQVHLHKAIPSGAGLGGGSANGAFMLRLLNEKFNLAIEQEQLIAWALQLGSDCPFFILNQPCFATGRGEVMQPLQLDLSAYEIVLVNPGIHVATGWAFKQLPAQRRHENLQQVISEPIAAWQNSLINDFEQPVFKAYPAVRVIRDDLYAAGALFSGMTGSGSTVFGIFEKGAIPELFFPEQYLVKKV